MTQVSLQADAIREIIQERVGGFFHNTFVPGTPGICAVCRGPAPTSGICSQCNNHRATYGNMLADRTVFLTYAQGMHPTAKPKHQSAHEVRAYKQGAGNCLQNLQLMVKFAVAIHHRCIATWLGARWDALTFVPSGGRPGITHPVVNLARAIVDPDASPPRDPQRFLLEPGRGAYAKHEVVDDRFVVPDKYRAAIDGKHVLIVDDTWTTGGSMQGASIAVKKAGARSATSLCVDRWLRWDWPDHERVLQRLDAPYDPLQCPVSGGVCVDAARYSW